jgi:hypothetical protein
MSSFVSGVGLTGKTRGSITRNDGSIPSPLSSDDRTMW